MKIITHSGPFHADDVLGVAIISKTCQTIRYNNNYQIVRTRDKAILEEGLKDPSIFLVDVGGVYEPNLNNFDHHFTGSPTRKDDGSPYAAAGLIAKNFYPALDEICRKIDLADNGIVQPGWSLTMTVHKCNPLKGGAEVFDERFKYLVALAQREIVEGITVYGYSLEFAVSKFESDITVVEWVEEYEASLAASEARVKKAFLQEGPFVTLTQYEPALMELAHLAPERKFYSIFPNPGGEWMVQQVPIAYKSTKGRKPLPEKWAGKGGAVLDAVTGIEECVFVHKDRFIGGHKTLDGATKMATLALSL